MLGLLGFGLVLGLDLDLGLLGLGLDQHTKKFDG